MKRFVTFGLGLFAVLAVSGSAQATIFQFYNDVGNNVDCAVGFDCIGTDAIAESLDFSKDGVSFTVTQTGALDVEQDTVPLYGGLGANGNSPNDNVDGDESLIFTSTSGPLFLMTVSMFDENHGLTNELFTDDGAGHGSADDDLEIFVDGVSLGTFDAATMIDLASMFSQDQLTGDIFTFQALNGEGFYIAGLDLVGSGVPEPGTALLIGLGIAGLASRRRTQLS